MILKSNYVNLCREDFDPETPLNFRTFIAMA